MSRSKYRYLAKNTMLFTISSFGSKLLSFFFVPFYTRVLTTTDFGTAELIYTTSTLLVYIFTLNISDAVMLFGISEHERKEEVFYRGIKIQLVGSLLLFAGLMIVYNLHVIEWPWLYFALLFIHFFTTATYSLYGNYLRAIDQIKDVAVAGIIHTAVNIACNLLFLLVFKTGVVGYILSLLLANVSSIIYCLIKCHVHLPEKSYLKFNELEKQMLKYSVPLIFNGVAWWINSSLDKYFITAMVSVSLNGIYSVSQKIPTILNTITSIFASAWGLSAIRDFDKDDSDGFFSKTYNVYTAALTCACSALIILNIPLAKFLFGKEFFSAWNYSSILLLSSVFSALSSFLSGAFSAAKDSKSIAVSTVWSAVVNIVLNALLIPKFNGIGAAIATVAAFGVMWVLRLVKSMDFIKMKVNIPKNILIFTLLAVQILVEHFGNHNYLIQFIVMFLIALLQKNDISMFLVKMLAVLKRRWAHEKG